MHGGAAELPEEPWHKGFMPRKWASKVQTLLNSWLPTSQTYQWACFSSLHSQQPPRHLAAWSADSNYSASTHYWINEAVSRLMSEPTFPLSEICFGKHVIRDPVSVLLPAPGHATHHLPLRGGAAAAAPWPGAAEQRIQGPPGHQNPPREGNLHLPPATGGREPGVRQRLAGRAQRAPS